MHTALIIPVLVILVFVEPILVVGEVLPGRVSG
jgi:hypothetical protein